MEGGGPLAAKKDGEELIKFLAEQVATYVQTPKEVRKHAKQIEKANKESWQSRWFGMLPLAIGMVAQQFRKSKRTPPQS
jgi:hypothetical protein